MMKEVPIADPALQKLLEANGILWKITKAKDGLNCLKFVFPRRTDLIPPNLICLGCQKPASLEFKNEVTHLESFGTIVQFDNVARVNVEGCSIDNMDDDAFGKLFPAVMEDDSPEAQLFEQCLQSTYLLGIDYREVIYQTSLFIHKRLSNQGIKMKPPSIARIRAALSEII